MADTGGKTTNDFIGGNKILIGLAIVAVLGWIAFLWALNERSATEREMMREIEAAELQQVEVAEALAALEAASGELTDIQAGIETSGSELASMDERRAEAQTAFEAELAELAGRRDTTSFELDGEIQRMTEEIEAARLTFEGELAELTDRRDVALQATSEAEEGLLAVNTRVDEQNAALEGLRAEQQSVSETLRQEQEQLSGIDERLTRQSEELQ
ncbi:MAG: hypothetical protein WBA25_11765, partial [Jannaschia sp.]